MSVMYHHKQSLINTPTPMSSTAKCLKIATIIFGTTGFIVWGLSIGFMIGWEVYGGLGYSCMYGGGKIIIGWAVSIPTNAAMVYVTARIILLISSRSFPSQTLLLGLHECVARMVTFTVLGLTMWAVSLSWLAKSDCESNILYHTCNYGFVLSALVAGLAGGLYSTTSRVAKHKERVMNAAVVASGGEAYQQARQPQTHYNQAYVQHYR